MKLFNNTIFISAIALGVASILAPANAQTPTAPSLPTLNKAALVFAIGGLGDGSFNDQTWAGLQLAGTDFGITVEYHEPGDPSNRETVLTQVANGDANMIIATGTMFSDIITTLAESHTTQSFVCIDYDHSGSIPPNLAGIDFREQEGAFLVGMIAALKSQTHTVGFVGAMPIPLIQRFQAGYTQGAHYAVPATQVTAVFASTTDAGFDDPVTGKALANTLIDGGVDVIFHASGSTGLGVFEAAQERGAMAIGVDKDQSAQAAPGVIITSMLKKEDVLIYDVIQDTENGQFPGGHHSYGLQEGTLDYVYNPAILSQSIHDQVESAKAKIISGQITVSPIPPRTAASNDWVLYN
jgi:basic membrane protein A